ncbi:hypothetical protein VTK26DRAFT_567 [Humicola hyalothermophila]
MKPHSQPGCWEQTGASAEFVYITHPYLAAKRNNDLETFSCSVDFLFDKPLFWLFFFLRMGNPPSHTMKSDSSVFSGRSPTATNRGCRRGRASRLSARHTHLFSSSRVSHKTTHRPDTSAAVARGRIPSASCAITPWVPGTPGKNEKFSFPGGLFIHSCRPGEFHKWSGFRASTGGPEDPCSDPHPGSGSPPRRLGSGIACSPFSQRNENRSLGPSGGSRLANPIF